VLGLAHERAIDGIRVPDLASAAGYSPFHFSRMFAASVGIPPGQYLTALRMDAAKRLLLNNEHAVIDIATAVGFGSLSSFSRRFRACVGIAPGQLRKLADRVADHPARPFRLVDEDAPSVEVTPVLPEGMADATLWVGWYASPMPIGLPASGVYTDDLGPLRLPLNPQACWLLGFAVPNGADVADQLVPTHPVVARLPLPVHEPTRVELHFERSRGHAMPMLSALPSLCRR